MKYCPQCSAQYDYDMSFCLHDGSALNISDESSVADAFAQETLELRQTPTEFAGEKTILLPAPAGSEPTVLAGSINPNAANRDPFTPSQFNSAPKKSYLGLLFGLLTAGLILIGSAIGGIFYFGVMAPKDIIVANTNIPNVNSSNSYTNVSPTNVFNNNSKTSENGFSNSNDKSNSKTTANTETAPKPIPTTKPVEKIDPTPIKTATPTPAITPTPTPNTPKVISGGVVNGKATNLVKPSYPPAALAVRASGQVSVQVLIDESGDVISANAVSGHPLLRQSATQAARASKFSPTLLSGQKVKVRGIVIYNFIP